MTSLSNLIKQDTHGNLKIETFRVQEIEVETPYGQGREEKQASTKGFKDRVSEIERDAYEKGFSQGHKDGLELGKKRLAESAKRLETVIKGLSELKMRLYREAEEEILRLAIEIAKKIVHKELSIDSNAVLGTIRKAMEFLNGRTSIRILLNPADMDKVEEALPQIKAEKKLDGIELVPDPTVGRGGCILETGFGNINATIEDQLAAIADELLDELSRNDHADAGVS